MRGESLASLGFALYGPVKARRHSAGRHMMRTTLPPNGVFLVLFRRQDDKGPVVVLEGGGVEVEESLASLGFALYGLVENPGDIVQVGT